MSLPQWFLLATMGFALVVLALKPLDAPRSLLVGLLAYLSPGLENSTNYVYGISTTNPLTVYVSGAIILATCIVGLVWPVAPASTQRLLRSNPGGKDFSRFMGWSALLFLLFIMARHGPMFFANVRSETVLSGYEQVVFRTLSSLTLIVGIVERNRFPIIISCVMLTIYTIMGDRTAVAMGAVAWFVHISYSKGWPGYKIVLNNLLIVLAGVIFVIQGKIYYVALNALVRGETEIAMSAFGAQAGVPEPVLVFQHLNQTIINGWTLEFQSLQGGLPGLLPFSSSIGFRSDQFNKLMQSELYPSVKPYSLAYNPWAEGWAMGGWFGIFVVWLILMVGLACIHYLASRRSGVMHALACSMTAYVGFYSQRNTIRTEIAFVSQLCLAIAVLFFIYKGWKWFKEVYLPQSRYFEKVSDLPDGQPE